MIALFPILLVLPLLLDFPDRLLVVDSTRFKSLSTPRASKTSYKFFVFSMFSNSLLTTRGKDFIPSITWPRFLANSPIAVDDIEEHNATFFSFLLIFLNVTFHDSGGWASRPFLTPATPAA